MMLQSLGRMGREFTHTFGGCLQQQAGMFGQTSTAYVVVTISDIPLSA